MLWCIVSAGIFFLNSFFFVQNTAFAYGFDKELQRLKDEKKISIDQKICSYTTKEFAGHSTYVVRRGGEVSIYALLMSLGMFVLTGIALFLQYVGCRKTSAG